MTHGNLSPPQKPTATQGPHCTTSTTSLLKLNKHPLNAILGNAIDVRLTACHL
jgi:hypothetical protein